jgi:hypothetical protein
VSDLVIRKLVVVVEETRFEAGRAVPADVRKYVVAAVLHNPLAGRYVDDLEPLVVAGEKLGTFLASRALESGLTAESVQGYGKAALVGAAGELEHGAALLHPRFGKAVRAVVSGTNSMMPSTAKRAVPGTTIDIPLHHVRDQWNFDCFDTVSFCVSDAPAFDEVLVALAFAVGGRPLARIRPDL